MPVDHLLLRSVQNSWIVLEDFFVFVGSQSIMLDPCTEVVKLTRVYGAVDESWRAKVFHAAFL